MEDGDVYTKTGHGELFIGKGSAVKHRTKRNKSCFEPLIVTCEESPPNPQGHGAALTVVNQEASHQSQNTG